MKIKLMNLRVPTGTHEAELIYVSVFNNQAGMKFLKLRFEILCKNRNYRLDKNYPDPENNPYFLELIESLEIPLEKDSILDTDDLKDYLYRVTVSEDKNGKRYIRTVVPAFEEEEEDFEDAEENDFRGEGEDAEENDFRGEGEDAEENDFRGEGEDAEEDDFRGEGEDAENFYDDEDEEWEE